MTSKFCTRSQSTIELVLRLGWQHRNLCAVETAVAAATQRPHRATSNCCGNEAWSTRCYSKIILELASSNHHKFREKQQPGRKTRKPLQESPQAQQELDTNILPSPESTPLTNGRLRLQVSVHDLVRVEVLQPADQLMNRSIARMHSEPTALVVACALALLLMTATQGTCHLQACLDTARSLTQCLPPTKRQHVHAKVSSDGNVFPGCAWTKKCLDICSLNLRPF